jgi:hypothetical protein
MKGTAITPAQYDAARRFIIARETTPPDVDRRGDDTPILLRFGDLVGLVAWYGALRYLAGRDGLNSLESPGETIVVPPATPEPTA